MEAQHLIPSDKMDSDAVITIAILNVKFTHLELCVYTNFIYDSQECWHLAIYI